MGGGASIGRRVRTKPVAYFPCPRNSPIETDLDHAVVPCDGTPTVGWHNNYGNNSCASRPWPVASMGSAETG